MDLENNYEEKKIIQVDLSIEEKSKLIDQANLAMTNDNVEEAYKILAKLTIPKYFENVIRNTFGEEELENFKEKNSLVFGDK